MSRRSPFHQHSRQVAGESGSCVLTLWQKCSPVLTMKVWVCAVVTRSLPHSGQVSVGSLITCFLHCWLFVCRWLHPIQIRTNSQQHAMRRVTLCVGQQACSVHQAPSPVSISSSFSLSRSSFISDQASFFFSGSRSKAEGW